MRFFLWQKRHPIRTATTILSAAALLATCFLWVRSYRNGDEVGVYLTHENARLCSAGGDVFWLSITNYPVAGKWFLRFHSGSPDHLWNLANGWGPTTRWYRFPESDYREPMFEFAKGKWKNFLTGEKPTPMRYTAARLPYWAIAALLALVAMFAGVGRRRAATIQD